MRHLFAQLSKESFIYGMSAALNKLIGFILVPIYANSLSVAGFGELNLMITGSSLLGTMLILGLDAAAAQRFYKEDAESSRRAIASTFLIFELALSFAVCALLFAFSEPLAWLLLGNSAYTGYVQIITLTVPFATFLAVFLGIARLARWPQHYLILSAGNLLLTAVLIVVAVPVLGFGVMGALVAILIGSITFSVGGWLLTHELFAWTFSPTHLRQMLILGLPLVPAGISVWVISFSSQWFLQHLSTLDDVGIFALATRLCAPVVLAVTAFQLTWVPFALSIAKHESADRVYARSLTYYLAVTLTSLLLLTLFANELIRLFATPAFLPAAMIVAPVGLTSIASGAYFLVATGVNLEGKTVHIGWTTLVAAGVSIALNLLLIPLLGIVGAAIAGLIANAIPVVLLYIMSQRAHRIPYNLAQAGLLTAVGAVALTAATLLQWSASGWGELLLRVMVLLIFVAALLPLGVVRGRDLLELRRVFYSFMRRGARA